MNPAVTLAFAVVRRLDWIKVPAYWLAQLLGAFIASAVVYGIYYGKFEIWAWSSIVSPPPLAHLRAPQTLYYTLVLRIPCRQLIAIFPLHFPRWLAKANC